MMVNQPAFVPHIDKIMSLPGIFVKQKIELLEVLTGCETENKYMVYEKKPGEIKKASKKKLYKCKEKSGCYSRQCLSNDCRAFNLKVSNLGFSDEYDKECLRVEKECTCTFLCFNRPFSKVYYTEDGGQTYLGKIRDPFDCCNFTFKVYDSEDRLFSKIYTHCCQCGIWCMGCCCEPCETVPFEVFDKDGNVMATLTKKNRNCTKSMLTDADNFGFDFPKDFTWEQRSLFLVTIVFIDFMMFEEKKGGGGAHGGY